jgi:L-aspartate oxidase
LYSQQPGRAFLISESVRGEGGILLNDKGVRFTDELQPRDVVTKAIHDEMARTGQKHVWLSMEDIPTDIIKSHFKHIYEHCLEEGYDCTKEPIPVVPAQHYFMGGVDVNSDSRTSMEQLYAVGETSCNGVHGANRLASNSLLESLVFAKRAALKIAEEYDNTRYDEELADMIDIHEYENMEQIVSTYKESVLSEIERVKKYHEQHNNEIKRRRPDSVSA